MLGFDFLQLTKILLQLGTVSVHLIEKCFQKAGFICSVPTAPETEPEPPRNIWDNMQQVLKVQVPIADDTTADDAVEMTERLSYADIVDLVKGRNQPEEEEEGEDPDDDDDDDDVSSSGSVSDCTTAADESEIIHTSAKFLCMIAQQKTYVLRNKLPSRSLDALNTIEQSVFARKLKSCKKKTNLLSFFTIDLLVTWTLLNKYIYVHDIKIFLFFKITYCTICIVKVVKHINFKQPKVKKYISQHFK